jgi:hypothetical protein
MAQLAFGAAEGRYYKYPVLVGGPADEGKISPVGRPRGANVFARIGRQAKRRAGADQLDIDIEILPSPPSHAKAI